MMKSALLILAGFLISVPNMSWAKLTRAAPLKYMIVKYDETTVVVKDDSGKRFEIPRSRFQGQKLLPGTTKIEVHPQAFDRAPASMKSKPSSSSF